jgi:hypothetical protein
MTTNKVLKTYQWVFCGHKYTANAYSYREAILQLIKIAEGCNTVPNVPNNLLAELFYHSHTEFPVEEYAAIEEL